MNYRLIYILRCRTDSWRRTNPLDTGLIENKTKAPDDATDKQIPERVSHSGIRIKAEIIPNNVT